MASNDSGAVGADAILRHIDAEADSISIEVTLYLWGIATGITVPSAYFGHYVANFFGRNDGEDVAGRIAALEAEQNRVFLHLRRARCYVAGAIVEHDSLRIRLSDVSAWTVAGIKGPLAESSPVPEVASGDPAAPSAAEPDRARTVDLVEDSEPRSRFTTPHERR